MKTKYDNKEYIVWIDYSEEYAQFITRSNEVLFFEDEPLGDIEIKDSEVIGNITDNSELLK